MHRGYSRGGSRVGGNDQAEGNEQPGILRGVHAGILQQ